MIYLISKVSSGVWLIFLEIFSSELYKFFYIIELISKVHLNI